MDGEAINFFLALLILGLSVAITGAVLCVRALTESMRDWGNLGVWGAAMAVIGMGLSGLSILMIRVVS